MLPETSVPRFKIIALSALVLAALAAGRPAAGDDRNTVRNSAGNPYVFIILDTSGSMNWAPPCSAADFALGKCPFLCPTGDCYVPLNGDDPSSKLYQAKSALNNVLKKEGNVHFGFASYNQDTLGLRGKHYLYEATTAGPAIAGFGNWPTPSAANPWREVFGYLGVGPVWGCSSGTGDNLAGCAPATPADVTKIYQLTRVKRLPKGDAAFNVTQIIYVLVSGNTYKVTYAPNGSPVPGAASISFNVTVAKCTNGACTTTSGTSTVAVTWNRVTQEVQKQLNPANPDPNNPTLAGVDVQVPVSGDFVSWDVGGGGNPQEVDPATTYFLQTQAADAQPTNTCSGWDPNTDNVTDASLGYSIRQPTAADPAVPSRGALFTIGDVVPWDWLSGADHNLDVRARLAPNLELTSSAAPDLTVASYFNNTPWIGEAFLRVPTGNAKDTVTAKSNHAPLIAGGATPIGASLQSFRTWFSGCGSGNCPANAGWKAVAATTGTGDPLYACSRKYVLFITDGDETCNAVSGTPPTGLACTVADDLNTKDGVKTFILGYGVPASTGNALTCVADKGGTGTPLLPTNQQALEQALEDLFGNIMENPTAFSSAAVPSVQAETSDKLFLTSFFPLNDQAIWDGHVDAFLKPLPLTPATGPVRTPDTGRLCSALGSNPSSCLLWDAAQVLVNQAPSLTDVAGGIYKIGNGATQRRVLYSYANPNGDLPGTLRTLTPPAVGATADWNDLICGLSTGCPSPLTTAGSNPKGGGMAYALGGGGITFAQAQTAATAAIRNVLAVKTANVSFTDGSNVLHSFSEPYVLGDIFHSDPLVYSNPDNFVYYAQDMGVGGSGARPCTGLTTDNVGYRCYAERHRKRRKMLVLGANDGQVHAFDAGTWDTSANDFNNGTGTEVFAYVPRLALPALRDQAVPGNTTQIYSVDGTVRIDDVFIDARHTAAAGPLAADREWRTVMIGGLREGGKPNGGTTTGGFTSGYYALDVTDPDPVNTSNVPTTTGSVASCLDTGSLNAASANCGTNPFAMPLWEFTDSITWINGSGQQVTSYLDEDAALPGKGAPDLGQTWSVPTIGVIQVTEGGNRANKSVAIFGGGFDSTNKSNAAGTKESGNWIYIVDVETGKAIYKHSVTGQVVGDPAVVDTNQDGILDTVYFGTTAGFLYKMDLSSAATLQNYTIPASAGLPAFTGGQVVKRVGSISPVVASAWDPFPIFSTGGLPIYLAPTVFFITDLNQYAVTFGSGDRDDLWSSMVDASANPIGGTFNVIIDEGFTAVNLPSPKTASNYQTIGSTSLPVSSASDFVVTPPGGKNHGWVMTLQSQERVINQAFGLGGIILFSTYVPDPLQPDPATHQCAFLGDSHNFVVFANNANPIATVNNVLTRYTVVTNKFVTNPFIEQGATKNAPASNTNSEQLDAVQQGILAQLKKLCPKGSKFGNYWISVSGVRSDTGYVRYGTIPICIGIKNWKEY